MSRNLPRLQSFSSVRTQIAFTATNSELSCTLILVHVREGTKLQYEFPYSISLWLGLILALG